MFIFLTLGHFIPSQSRVSLWELDSDYHLHNKTLRPPLAYADELLCNLKGNYFIQERQNQFFDMNEDDTIVIGKSNVRHQYVVAPFVDTVTAEEAINRKELRKLIHREKSQRIEEAQQEWWKLAIHEYDAQKDWLCIKMNDDEEGGSKWTSFDRVYRPEKLTSFDSIVADDEFSCPIVIDSSTSEYIKRKEKSSSMLDHGKAKYNGKDADTGTDTGTVRDTNTHSLGYSAAEPKTEGSMLGKIGSLAGQIGKGASRLVGGIGNFLRRDEVVDRPSAQVKTHKVSSFQHKGETSVEEDMYIMYVESNERLAIESKGYGSCEHEFQQCMKEFTIDLDDAIKMKDLMKNSSIGYTIEEGEYSGMSFTDDVKSGYIGPTFQALVALEGSMESSARSIDSPAVASTIDPYSYASDLMLSSETTRRLEKIAEINHFSPGLELSLQVNCSQFLLDQAMYNREIVPERICRKTSTLSSSKTLAKYASYFEKESLAIEYSQIEGFVNELVKPNNRDDMEYLLASLKPFYELYRKSLDVLPTELQGEVCIEIASSTEVQSLDSLLKFEYPLPPSGKEYPGFVEISYDLYAKTNNPYFRLNETALVSYLETKVRKKQFDSQTGVDKLVFGGKEV